MNGTYLVWIALGGALGSVVRAVLIHFVPSDFPWATLFVNVVGSFVIGVVLALTSSETEWHMTVKSLLAVGFCGAFTTFSTFSYQTLMLIGEGRHAHALLNIGLSIGLTLLAVWLGMRFVGPL